MCGIVGVVGREPAAPFLLDGLRRLEYRGYDSAGIAVIAPNGTLHLHRAAGKLQNLVALVTGREPHGAVGIGHTRWATHGRPSDENAHPHTDCTGRICVVHNGIIENFATLRDQLQARGHTFRSETDTEVLAHLIEEELARLAACPPASLPVTAADGRQVEGDGGRLRVAVHEALLRVQGAYALAAISLDEPHLLVGAARHAPLVVGIGDDANYLASDIPALLPRTRLVIRLREGELVALDRDRVLLYDETGRAVERLPTYVEWDQSAAEKAGYPHFTLKEIHEQPEALRRALAGRLTDGRAYLAELDGLDLSRVTRVYLVGCGTSHYAGMVAKYAWEQWLRLPVECIIGSEMRYAPPPLDEHALVIAISQSGETADTRAAAEWAARAGARTLALTNVVGSSLTQTVEASVYLYVGPEIGVVSTKAFTGQLAVLYAMGLDLAARRGTLPPEQLQELAAALAAMPERVAACLARPEPVQRIAAACVNVDHLLFIGRGVGYPTALEGALKLKEVSYIHAEGYPAGELKHGPIALVEPGKLLIALATASATYDKVLSNLEEVKARGARVVAIATEGDTAIQRHADHVLYVPAAPELLSPIVNVVPMQLLAYYAAVERGCDVDQPRNLAKSVTVE
ncbi:MAG: glutamine--fructose-6-phosphate transaminase (isomerizing) [Chloroflexi bacterium]|nr:glutamine--fructose-6-phosphate transaminase (isomerizing) [Chloroflexota bacterium]